MPLLSFSLWHRRKQSKTTKSVIFGNLPSRNALIKSGKKLAELIEVLRTGDAIRKKKMTVYGVTNCGMESERVYRGLDELTEAKGYLTIVIVKYS